MMKLKTYRPGETIIEKGEMSRDLFFLTEGVVEISTSEQDGGFILNEIKPPQLFGDIAFFYGLPRTATAKAKTEVEVFVLKFENIEYKTKDLPELLKPIFSTFVSRIQSLDDKIRELEMEIAELKKN